MSGRRTTRSSARSSDSLSEGNQSPPLTPVCQTDTPRRNIHEDLNKTVIQNTSTPVSHSPGGLSNIINTPHHLLTTSASKPCLCGKVPYPPENSETGLLKCSVCSHLFHLHCVGLGFLSSLTQIPLNDGLFNAPKWSCPGCIVSAHFLHPDSPIFEAIAEKAARIISSSSRVASTPSSKNVVALSKPDHSHQPSPMLSSLDYSQALQRSTEDLQTSLSHDNLAKSSNTPVAETRQKVRKLKISCGTNNPEKVSKAIDSCLRETPMMFMDKKHPAEVRIGLPDSADIGSIKNLIAQSIPTDTSISEVRPTAKVTILHVPENIEDLSRDQAKAKILSSLLCKNPWLKDYEISVVYIKSQFKNKEKCTVALRLPIPAQKRLLETGKVFYGSCRLNVVERFHIPQCIKCHQFNHQTKDCTSNILVCKLCGEDHDVKACTNTGKRFCTNCNNSEKFQHQATNHHSGDRNCPFRISLIQEQSKNGMY